MKKKSDELSLLLRMVRHFFPRTEAAVCVCFTAADDDYWHIQCYSIRLAKAGKAHIYEVSVSLFTPPEQQNLL